MHKTIEALDIPPYTGDDDIRQVMHISECL